MDDNPDRHQPMQRVIVTGCSGYLGRKLVGRLRNQGATVLGVDLQPRSDLLVDDFIQGDVCDPALGDRFRRFEPDTVIHAAFIVKPIHDEAKMRRINIGGTENILSAAAKLSLARFMLLSSATAYGAWDDNPVPMDETWPTRARHDFAYAANKVDVEQIVDDFSRRHPAVAVSRVRPTIIAGPGMDNYLRRIIFDMPFLIRFDGKDLPIQFVHEDDVISAIETILAADGRGPYNIAPPDWTFTAELADETNRRYVSLPFWLVKAVAWIAWTTRFPLHETPPGYLHFARHSWVVTPKRLCTELGFQFQYSSLDTLRAVYRQK